MTEWDTSEVTCHPARLPFYINRADPNTKICMQISHRAARFQDRERGRELFSDWSAHVITDQSRHIHCRQLGIEGSIESRRVFTLPEKKKSRSRGATNNQTGKSSETKWKYRKEKSPSQPQASTCFWKLFAWFDFVLFLLWVNCEFVE